jgi:hypothetical protein
MAVDSCAGRARTGGRVRDAGAVKFGFEQSWAATVDEVVAVYTDEGFWTEVTGFSRTSGPEVLEVRTDGDTALTRLRWHLSVELPREATRFIDPDDVSWVEETRWDLPAASATVTFHPDQGASLMRASAEVAMAQQGAEALRTVRGELKVRIPLLGGRVERAVVDAVGEHLEEEADAVATRLGA